MFLQLGENQLNSFIEPIKIYYIIRVIKGYGGIIFLTTIIRTGNDGVCGRLIHTKLKIKIIIFLHHSAGKNTGFNLFSFSASNSKTDGWIFMLIALGFAPFVLVVAAGTIDNLTATGIYSLLMICVRYHVDW